MQTTVFKGLRVLEHLARATGPVPLGEIAETCGISKSNAHRLLHTLSACGYVHHDPSTHNYQVTLRMWDMGSHVYDRMELRTLAAPHLEWLAANSEETVHLAVLDNYETLYLDTIDGIHAVRTYVKPGDRAPAYATASGKAMLAYQPEETVKTAAARIERRTEKTVADLEELKTHLARIRETGYSITFGEWREGVAAVSRPIRDAGGRVLAAIGVAGPVDRAGRTGMDSLQAAVKRAADSIEQALATET